MQAIVENKFPPIKGRVYNYLKIKGIPLSIFFQRVQISDSAFKGRSAKSEFGGEILSRIVDELEGISPLWLLTGRGEMEDISTSSVTGIVKGNNNIVASSGIQLQARGEISSLGGIEDSVLTLIKEQLIEKDRQLREKDKQIELLLSVLNRSSV